MSDLRFDNVKVGYGGNVIVDEVSFEADKGSITKGEMKSLLIMLNPFAPHITEEMYHNIFGTEDHC